MRIYKSFLTLLLFFFALAALGQEYNPFQSIGKKGKILTLSKGKYVEVFDYDTIQRIGSVLYNIRTKKIVKLLDADKTYENFSDNSSASRWYSVDPLADKFSQWSPYNFVYNNPINFVDPDGREAKDWIKLGENKIIFDKNVTTQEQATAKYGSDAKDLGKTYAEKGAKYNADGSAFFKSETKAYNFMWNNSNYGQGINKETEHFAYITKDGVAVLPTEGKTFDGKDFKNNYNTAEPFVYKTSGSGKTFSVDFNGTTIKPIAMAHTHPWSNSMAWHSHSGEDVGIMQQVGIKSVVFGPNNVYMSTPSHTQPIIIGTLINFLKDGFVIIPNIDKIK